MTSTQEHSVVYFRVLVTLYILGNTGNMPNRCVVGGCSNTPDISKGIITRAEGTESRNAVRFFFLVFFGVELLIGSW